MIPGLEGTKHRKSLANTAIAKDLVQPETLYGRLDAHLDLEVIPCEMRRGTAWTMNLIPCWLKCWMSANGALLYQWNSLFCLHLCSLPSLVSEDDNASEPQLCSFHDCILYVNLLGYKCGPHFSGVIGFQNSSSLPAYGFKGNSTSCTPFIFFDMELPGLHPYVLVGLFGFSLVLLHMLFGTCISNFSRLVRLQLGLALSLHGLVGFGEARGSTKL